jgi:hypothetical protein
MNNTTAEHNNLFPDPVLSTIQSPVYQNYTGNWCSDRRCPKSAKNLLEILFINKRGYFGDECTRDLLARKLVVDFQEGDLS